MSTETFVEGIGLGIEGNDVFIEGDVAAIEGDGYVVDLNPIRL